MNGLRSTHTLFIYFNTLLLSQNEYNGISLRTEISNYAINITVWDYTFEFIDACRTIYIYYKTLLRNKQSSEQESNRRACGESKREKKEHQLYKIMAIRIEFNAYYS